MSKIDQIEIELKSIDQAKFQKLCDNYFFYQGYEVKSFGSATGMNKTKSGTPDAYVLLPNKKYLFIEYTTKAKGLLEKFLSDLGSCFDEQETGIPKSEIEKVILCYNSKLPPKAIKELSEKCSQNGCECEFVDIDKLKFAINEYPKLGLDYLNIIPDSGQILRLNDFLKEYASRGKFATTLNNKFYFRNEDLTKGGKYLEVSNLLILSGKSGVGKTKFAIELCQQFIEKNKDYELFCIFNRYHPDLYYEIKTYFKANKKYLVLIDDANRLAQFDHFLQLLKKDQPNIKLVVTVRDYAKDKITLLAKDYHYEVIELNQFEDNQIREILTEYNFNNRCLEIIERISNGNARLAMMAAKVAKETNDIESLKDVSDLYDEYFSDISNKVNDPDLLKVLGIISFFKYVSKENKELTTKIYNAFHITEEIFWNKTLELHNFEVVDLEEQDKAMVKISDQILATYFFYKVFIKEKIIDYTTILLEFFEDNKEKIKDSIYSVFYAFGYQNVYDNINEPLNSKFDRISEDNEVELLEFFQIFWFCKKAQTLSYILDKVNHLPTVSKPQYSFVANNDSIRPKDKYLEILKLFGHHSDEYFKHSLEIIFCYITKKPNILPLVIRYFQKELTFDIESYNYEYYIQTQLFDFLFEKLESADKELAIGILFQISNAFLQTNFSTVSAASKNQYRIHNFGLNPSDVIKGFRERIWMFLLEKYSDYPEEGFTAFSNYINNVEVNPSTDILDDDKTFIISFFDTFLSTDEYNHCKLVHTYFKRFSRNKVLKKSDQDLKEKFTNDDYKLSILLQWNYEKKNGKYIDDIEEYDKYKKNQLSNYFKKYDIRDYQFFFNSLSVIFKNEKSDTLSFQQSIDAIFTFILEKDQELFFDVIEKLFAENGDLRYAPYKDFFINANSILKGNKRKFYALIQKYSFLCKIDWQLNFLGSLGKDEIDIYYLNELISILISGEVKLFYFRYFDNYAHVMPDILKIVITQLLEKHKNENFQFDIHDEDCIEKLILQDSANIEIAKTLYLYLKSNSRSKTFDHNGDILKLILSIDAIFIVDFMETEKDKLFIRKNREIQLQFIWELDNYEEIMNYVFTYILVRDRTGFWGDFLETIFVKDACGLSINRMEECIRMFINSHYSNPKAIELIFDVINEFPQSKVIRYVKQVISLNPDIEFFKKLPLVPTSRGSVLNVYEDRLAYWESIYNNLTEFEYLKHRSIIQKRIDSCKMAIREEVKREFFKNDY